MSLPIESEAEVSQADAYADDEARRRPTWFHVVVAAMVMALVGGAVGYVIGEGRPPGEDSVDVGFLRDMIDHHEQAVVMSRITLRADGIDPITRSFAEETFLFQQREVGLMDAQLNAWGRLRGDLDRRAMLWMGMDTSVAEMPGMQTDAALDELKAASGLEADRLFLTMMSDHHRGGVHMAKYAAKHAASANVRELADRMARYQQAELGEYAWLLRRLGLAA